MKNKIINYPVFLAAMLMSFLLAMPASAQDLSADLDGNLAIRTVKKLLVSIRLNKNDKALAYMNLNEMSKYLLGQNYTKLNQKQQSHFESSLGKIIQLKAFPWARKNIGSIGLSYDKPVIKKNRVHVLSTLVYAGKERISFTWVLGKFADNYLVTDVLNIKGQSSLKESRDRQIIPVYKKRGAKGLLERMDSVIQKLQKQ